MSNRLRPYQRKLAEEAVDSLRNHDRIVVVSPTGSGKTKTAIEGIIPNLEGRTLWVTHRRELGTQATGAGACDVQMIQSLRVGTPYENVIIDEGHHVCADTYRELFELMPKAKFIALTATPYRMDGVGLGTCGFTAIVYGPDVYELTEMGFLAPCRVFVPTSESEKAWAVKATCEAIREHHFTKALTYCRSIEDAEAIAANLSRGGIQAVAVSSNTPTEERAAISRRFIKGKLRVVTNHTIYTEGYDAPAIDLLVLNRHTKSRCLWRQMVGRGLRPSTGKRECLILDLASNGVQHGSIYDREVLTLTGAVERVERRTAPITEENRENTYEYANTQPLKEWTPTPPPSRLHENLQKLKSKSPLHRFTTGW